MFDTQHLRHPEYFRATHRVAWRVLVDAALARSGRIVCPSVATRVDLETLRPRHSRKYRHVPLGVEDEWLRDRGADDAATWRHRFGLPERFAVCLATTHPHKGHDTLLRAWRSMLDAGAAPPPLVLTGVSGFADRAIHESARQLRVDSHVRHLGWIAREDLRMLLSSATVALLPSRFEGFGLPLLEAMALGTPAVANDLPVFREVGGDLVHLVAATDGAAWAEAIRAVLALPDGVRREWAVRSRRAAAAWTWDRAASALRAVLAETLTAGRSVDGMETREV
ncbi:MAG: glycosyltransferase family 4 protein [Deltaproteobacteria bacterium]|nr:glycosyltransferase family 4 protein [Deltaproteobacteria bacterium]